jgi:hypothetical protein
LDEIKARRAAGGQGAKIFAHRVVIASAAKFIAHAPDDVDWLIGEVEQLLGEVARLRCEWSSSLTREKRWRTDVKAIRAERDAALAEADDLRRQLLDETYRPEGGEIVMRELIAAKAERDRLAAELAVAVAALESGDACGAVGCRALVERDRLAAQVRAVEALCVEAERWPAQWRSVPPARIRAALASAATPGRPRRYDQCDGTCTVDCGHCKGNGRPEPAPDTSWIKMERP